MKLQLNIGGSKFLSMRLVLAFLLLVDMNSVVYAQNASSASPHHSSNTQLLNAAQLMPDGFKDVFLDMPRSELLRQRKLKALALHDPEEVKAIKFSEHDLFLEKVSASPYIENAMYGITPEGRIAWIVFSKKEDGKYIKQFAKKFVTGALSKWGRDPQVHIGATHRRTPKENVTLVWQKGLILISASLPHAAIIGDSDVGELTIKFNRGDLASNKRNLQLIEHPKELNLTDIKKEIAELARETTLPDDVFR